MATFGSAIISKYRRIFSRSCPNYPVNIDKSGKRFAPKAAPRRAAGATQTTAHINARGSIERRTLSITPGPLSQEPGSLDIRDHSVNANQEAVDDASLDNAPTKSFTKTRAGNSQSSEAGPISNSVSKHTGRHSSSQVHPKSSSSASRSTQTTSLGPLAEENHSFDDTVTTSTPARRSSRVRKETSSTNLQHSPRKRQRSVSSAGSQAASIGENSLGSHQPLGVLAHQKFSGTAGTREGSRKLDRSARSGRTESDIAPGTFHDSVTSETTAISVEPPSTQKAREKSIRKSKQQIPSTANVEIVSKRKKKTKPSTEAGQSQFLLNDQQASGNEWEATAEPENINGIGTAGFKRRRRAKSPENSEAVEISTSVVKMSELCKDLRTGKKSKRAEEIEKLDWTEVLRKQRESKARREAGELPQQETVDEMLHRVGEEAEIALQLQQGPQMRVVNGQLVVDDASLQIDRHAAAAKSTENFEEIEESELTRRVNAGTWLKREKTETWTQDDISLLYQGLRMFGTDFEIIAKMFPLRSRRQIKLRYNKEERIDPVRLKQALSGKTTEMNLEEYCRLTDATYEDPAIFNAELERKRQEHELEQVRLDEERAEEARKRREDNERSVEPEEDGNNGSQKENDIQAANLVAAAVGKIKKTKRKAKKPTVGKSNKKSQHSRKVAGEAEVLGPVDEV